MNKIDDGSDTLTNNKWAKNSWYLSLYTLDENGDKDIHTIELPNKECLRNFINMIQNTQSPKTEQDTIFIGVFGPILEVEYK